VPEPLAALILRLKQAHPPRGNIALSTEPEWMFTGLRLDTAMHEEVMRRRLRRLGITVRATRSSAALQLAQTLPAAILADLLGFDQGTAEDWTQLANSDWLATQQHAEPSRRPTPGDTTRQ
jgi:hypothetical protein